MTPKQRRRREGQIPLERVIEVAAFRSALRSFLRHSEQIAYRWDLTPQRYLLLLAIKGSPDGSERASFTDLAERMQLSRNTVTELVARAEEVGLVVREPAEHDLRVVYLRLTPEGDRRICGALVENDEYRHELAEAFAALAASFHTASSRG